MNSNFYIWMNNPYFDIETKQELLEIKDDLAEIEDRFYKNLDFGTGGIRGLIGAGTNRINIYTIRRISYGLANFIKNKNKDINSIVIAYDTRNKSKDFAMEAAKTLASCGIKVYIFDDVRSTPQLSFTVRYMKASGGIVITASHNPKEYNGYKVYNCDGCQICLDDANAISSEISKIDDYSLLPSIDENEAIEKGLLIKLEENIDDCFIEAVKKQMIRSDIINRLGKKMKIVYTPLNGTGSKIIERVLSQVGFTDLIFVEEQRYPDKDFSTLKYPNPEEKESFNLAIKLAKKVDANIIIATDPDCDRVGIGVKNNEGEYILLNGNQIGSLLVNYTITNLIEQNRLQENSVIIKTIVTSELGAEIAKSYNVECINTLTGFKFIGEKVEEFEKSNEKSFIMGYEESLGYLIGNHCRDKDGVVSALLICEMATYYFEKNMSLYEALEVLYKQYGYYYEELKTITLKGADGLDNIESIMNYFRNTQINIIDDVKVTEVKDYKDGIDSLPKSNVLKYIFDDSSWVAIRPSGTEPKLKMYLGSNESNMKLSKNKVRKLADYFDRKIIDVIQGGKSSESI